VELINHTIYNIRNSILSSNTYIVSAKETRESVLIDPGMDFAAIDKVIEGHNLYPTDILVTHGHFDHVGSVAFFQKKYSARFHIHQLDIKALRSVNFFLRIMKIDSKIDIPVPDNIIKGDITKMELGNFHFEAYNLPGHTDGSCVFKVDECLFSGDTLYTKGVGINHFPGKNNDKLRSSLRKIFAMFGPSVIVYPGHGTCEKLGKIQETNFEIKQFLESNIEI
jgi:hydroxyacylglutathione hydrolase